MSNPLLFIVDDDPLIQDVLRANTEAMATVECFGSAEECDARMQQSLPDLLLLDIGLPGMDGYNFCGKLKNDDARRAVPVIFVSAHDTLEERLAGFDVGAEDFIIKPFDPEVLLRKIRVLLQIVADRKSFKEQMDSADQLTSLALASMDEAGIVLQFMSKLIGFESDAEIAQGLLELLQRFGINGVIQTRVGSRAHTQSREGVNVPLEVSVLNHVRTLDRIFEFRKRAVFNFDRVTLMINNMPADQDVCGRIRDNMSIAAQGADSRLAALETAEARERDQAALISALESLQGTLMEFRESHKAHRLESSQLGYELEEDLARAFVHLGLTTGQERYLEDMIRARIAQLMQMVDKGDDMEKILTALLGQLGTVTRTSH